MPKQHKGGNKRKKGKKNIQEEREFRFKDENEEYAQIIKILGDGRFQCKCSDGIDRIARIRKKMFKKVWVKTGDIILISLREYEKDKCDIIDLYNEKEVEKLKTEQANEMSFISNEVEKKEETGVIFEDNSDKTIIKKNKKENSNGFEFESENENESEEIEEYKEEEKQNDGKEEINDNFLIEKENRNKKAKKEKDRKRKNNRDNKKEGKEYDSFDINNYL